MKSLLARPRTPRIRRRLLVRFGPSLLEQRQSGFTVDISLRGLGLTTTSVPGKGTALVLTLTLPDGQIAALEGEVAWARSGARTAGVPGYVGVKLSAADEQFIAFAAAQAPAPSEVGHLPPMFVAPSVVTPSVIIPPRPVVARQPRFAEALPVRLIALSADAENRGVLEDVSRSGLALTCALTTTPPAGTRVLATVTTPDGERARVAGTVAWAAPGAEGALSRLGLRLTRSDEVWTRLLDELEGG